MADDYTHDLTTTGAVSVGGAATGEIEQGNDFDWFTVELVAGRTYVIDVEGSDTGNGTLDNPVLRGLYDSGGVRIAGTQRTGGAAPPTNPRRTSCRSRGPAHVVQKCFNPRGSASPSYHRVRRPWRDE